MKIILNHDIPGLGEEGDIKSVANGYARNYLIPKKLALPYTKGNLDILEQKTQAIERRKEEKRKSAMGLKERLANESITVVVPAGENGRLFGAVTNTMVMEKLAQKGISVDRKSIEIENHHLKVVGTHSVKVKLYGGEIASLTVEVEGTEASTSSQTERKPLENSSVAESSEPNREDVESVETKEEAPLEEPSLSETTEE